MGKNIRRQILQVAVLFLLLFGALAANIIYLMTFAADGLASNALNPRNSAADSDTIRGTILDANGRVLAQSSEDGTRSWPLGEMMAHVVGYHGERSGSVGVESYANKELIGMTDGMYRLGPAGQLLAADVGNTVTLSLDSEVQQAAWEGLEGRKGAVVVMDVDTGAVLALVSSPSFDPERVEEDWDNLLEDAAEYPSILLCRYKAGKWTTLGDTENEYLQRAGLNHDFVKDFDKSYYAVVLNGVLLKESSSPFSFTLHDHKIVLGEDEITIDGASVGKAGEMDLVFASDSFDWVNPIPVDYQSRWFWKNGCEGFRCTASE